MIEEYKRYVEKVGLLHEQRKRRPLPIARGLQHFLGNFTEIAEVLELDGVTKAHVMGLGASMGNLKKSESALGLFSDPFIDTAEDLARGIVDLAGKKAPRGAVKVVQWWLEMTLLTLVGLLDLAKEKKVSKEGAPLDTPFRDQMLLTLLFYTGYPKLVFKQMAEALRLQKPDLFVELFQGAALVFALASYSGKEGIREDLGETLSMKLMETIVQLLKDLPDENKEIRSYLELARMALEKGDIDQLTRTLFDWMKEAGYSRELLLEDLVAMKDLFKRLKIAYFSANEKSTNMVHMLG